MSHVALLGHGAEKHKIHPQALGYCLLLQPQVLLSERECAALGATLEEGPLISEQIWMKCGHYAASAIWKLLKPRRYHLQDLGGCKWADLQI